MFSILFSTQTLDDVLFSAYVQLILAMNLEMTKRKNIIPLNFMPERILSLYRQNLLKKFKSG